MKYLLGVAAVRKPNVIVQLRRKPHLPGAQSILIRLSVRWLRASIAREAAQMA